MRFRRISIRGTAADLYNGIPLSPRKSKELLQIWEFLELVRHGRLRPTIKGRGPTVQVVGLPSGNNVYLTMGKPRPTDPDHDFDFYLSEIRWPDEVN